MNNVKVNIGNRAVGDNEPVYVIAEIGVNHNGSIDIAKALVEGAKKAGADVVKFQKRTPELCVPRAQWNVERDTPWGRITYIEYRRKVEFNFDEYKELDDHCKKVGIDWSASCWDEEAVDFIEQFNPPFFKVASASLTDTPLLAKVCSTGRPVIISTGMSTMDEIIGAASLWRKKTKRQVNSPALLIAHSTSTYPCSLEELNLRMITTLKEMYPDAVIGYSGHETGLAPSLAAVSIGASFVERHITLDRAMWGTDQAASVEIGGFERLVNNIRDIERALGDGIKKVYPSEMRQRQKLRRAS